MDASLVLFLLISISVCHAKMQDGHSSSVMLPTTKWQNMPLEASCPDPLEIQPCECTKDGSTLVMGCSNVQNEEELRRVFSEFFPTTEMFSFYIKRNTGLKILEDGVFGNVSFHYLSISESVLETVEFDALTPSLSTLTHIWISFCMLETFPFERLTEFTSLQILELNNNKIHTLPPISSSSLGFLNLRYNLITQLMPDVFTFFPAIEGIRLDNNLLTEIPRGTFTRLPKLFSLDLSFNNISYLPKLTFELASSPYSTTSFHLSYNNIADVEVDAFNGVAASAYVYMHNNALTRLPEEVWRPALEKNITVKLEGNDLACGCDVAWLVRDPQLLTTVIAASCADGTLLTDLSSDDFDMCG